MAGLFDKIKKDVQKGIDGGIAAPKNITRRPGEKDGGQGREKPPGRPVASPLPAG